MIYVDNLLNNGWKMYGRNIKNCHLIADSVDELQKFAVNELGMKIEWYQAKSTPHFDLTESRRKLAISKGAIELNRIDFVRKLKEIRNNADTIHKH